MSLKYKVKYKLKSSFFPSNYSFHRILDCTLNEVPFLAIFFYDFNVMFNQSKLFEYEIYFYFLHNEILIKMDTVKTKITSLVFL